MIRRNERVKVDCGTNAGSQVPVGVFLNISSTVFERVPRECWKKCIRVELWVVHSGITKYLSRPCSDDLLAIPASLPLSRDMIRR